MKKKKNSEQQLPLGNGGKEHLERDPRVLSVVLVTAHTLLGVGCVQCSELTEWYTQYLCITSKEKSIVNKYWTLVTIQRKDRNFLLL